MKIDLTFRQPYLSISAFPATRLPAFTLITGLNGSGKTHLLKAINLGHISVEGVEDYEQDVRYFDWITLVPQKLRSHNAQQIDQERKGLIGRLDKAFARNQEVFKKLARNEKLPEYLLHQPRLIAKLSQGDLLNIFGDSQKAELVHLELERIRDRVSVSMKKEFTKDIQELRQLESFSKEIGLPIASIDGEVLIDRAPIAWGAVDLFQQSFARLFGSYRDLIVGNNLKRLARNDGDEEALPLSDDEFRQKYNIPPWDFVNSTLSSANLDFEINPPNLYSLEIYEPKLRKKSTGAEIEFQDLSSGEKILISFANCIYYAQDSRQISIFPKIILLDEVDAPLHPSMSRVLVQAITKTLVGTFGIKVIATTHSPSTVAMVDECSVYTMEPSRAGIYKSSKNQALNLLTSGVPVLSFDYSGRRQIFVESETDAKIYEYLFQILRAKLQSERSLSFLSPGFKDAHGDHNNGCGQVRRIVNKLKDFGNKSVLGLIDWDGVNTPTERIKILAYKQRDGLENVILDPLILTCLIAQEIPDRRQHIGIEQHVSAYDLKKWPSQKLQHTINLLEDMVIGKQENVHSIECLYLGGLSLKIRSDYLLCDDHQLEQKVLDAIPSLRRYNGNHLIHITQHAMRDFPDFIPTDIFRTFKELLDVDL